VTAEDSSSLPVVEQHASTESSLLCASAPLRETITQSGNNALRQFFYYYLTDQVGTVLQIVKEDGTVVNQYDYDAFGRVRWDSANTWEQADLENRYLFQGREWDKNGGFYYFRNRIYLPERGEFSSPDMNLGRGILGELDGMATLTFCGGDPVNCVDPTGLAWEDVYEWHHMLGQRVFSGTKGKEAYIKELGLELAPDVDIHDKKWGRVMRAGPHHGEGQPHNLYDSELKSRVQEFNAKNPKIKQLTEKHLNSILDSIKPEFKKYNQQGLPAKLTYAEWRNVTVKRLKNRFLLLRLKNGTTVRQPVKKGQTFSKIRQGLGSVLRGVTRTANIVIAPLMLAIEEVDAAEYREALILQSKYRGEDDADIEKRLKVREELEIRGRPAIGPSMFGNPLFDPLSEKLLELIPDDEIGPEELPKAFDFIYKKGPIEA